MSIAVTCQCGEPLYAPDDSAGKQIRCPACGVSVPIIEPGRGSPMVRFTCPCGQPCQAQIEHAGRKTQCPRCHSFLSIPFTDRVAPRVLEDSRSNRSDLTERPGARPVAAFRRDDARDDRQEDGARDYDIRKRKGPTKKKQTSSAWVILLLGGIGLLAVGGVILWMVLRNKISEDFDLVPRDAQMFATIKVPEALDSVHIKRLLDNLPDKGPIREAEKKLGLKLEDLERATFVMLDVQKNIDYALVHTRRDYDEDKILAAMGGPAKKTHNDKTYYLRQAQGPDASLAVHFAGPRLIVVGDEEGVQRCLELPAKPKNDGPLADALKLASKDKSHIAFAMNLTDDKLKAAMFGQMRMQGNAAAFAFGNPLDQVKSLSIAAHLSSSITLTLEIELSDRTLAKQVESEMDQAIRMAKNGGGFGGMPPEANLVMRVLAMSKCSRSGSTVELEMEFDAQTIDGFVDLVKKQMGQNFPGWGN